MNNLISTEDFPTTNEFLKAVGKEFAQGAELVSIANGSKIVAAMLSPDAAKKALALKVAEQWITHPDLLEDLEASLGEQAEQW